MSWMCLLHLLGDESKYLATLRRLCWSRATGMQGGILWSNNSSILFGSMFFLETSKAKTLRLGSFLWKGHPTSRSLGHCDGCATCKPWVLAAKALTALQGVWLVAIYEAMMMPFQKFPEFDEMHFKEVFLGQLCGMYGMYVWHVCMAKYFSNAKWRVKEERLKMCQGARLCVSLICCHVF